MQIHASRIIARTRLEQAGSASDDNVAPGSVKIRDPLNSQAPGARRLAMASAARQAFVKNAQKTQKARIAFKQSERSSVFPAAYQPR